MQLQTLQSVLLVVYYGLYEYVCLLMFYYAIDSFPLFEYLYVLCFSLINLEYYSVKRSPGITVVVDRALKAKLCVRSLLVPKAHS